MQTINSVDGLLSGRQNSLRASLSPKSLLRASQNDAQIASRRARVRVVGACNNYCLLDGAIGYSAPQVPVGFDEVGLALRSRWSTESIVIVVSKGIDFARFLQLSKMTDMSLPRLVSCRCSAHYAMSQLLHTIPSPFMPIPTHDSGPGGLSRHHDFKNIRDCQNL